MPQIRLEYGEDWQDRFAREYNKPRRIGAFWGLIVGVILTLVAIYWVIPALGGVNWGQLFSFQIG